MFELRVAYHRPTQSPVHWGLNFSGLICNNLCSVNHCEDHIQYVDFMYLYHILMYGHNSCPTQPLCWVIWLSTWVFWWPHQGTGESVILNAFCLFLSHAVEQGLGHIWGKNSAPLKMIDFPRLSQFEGIKMFRAPPRLTGKLKRVSRKRRPQTSKTQTSKTQTLQTKT